MEEVAGFVIADGNNIIGRGKTGIEALYNAKQNLHLHLWPATKALLVNLGPWHVVDGIAMMEGETGP